MNQLLFHIHRRRHRFLLLLLIAAMFVFATSTFVEGAICQCRCCSRLQLQTHCSLRSFSVPSASCDALSSRSDNFDECGQQMCFRAFPKRCISPHFFRHRCVSHVDGFRRWMSLLFAVCALLVMALLVCFYERSRSRRDSTLPTSRLLPPPPLPPLPPLPPTSPPSFSSRLRPALSAAPSRHWSLPHYSRYDAGG